MAITPQAYQHLPPSPPPSPPRHRHHKKPPKDPFLELSDPAFLPDHPPKDAPEERQESLISKLFWTPLLFTSFLLSLFLINRSDRRARLISHPPNPTATPSLLSYFSPSSWIDPEPYQSPSSTTWDRRNSTSHVEPNAAINHGTQTRKRKSWHLHRKIRKVARVEIGDAFEMQWSLVIVLLAAGVVLGVGGFVGLRWMWMRMWGGR
ncbi:hypothetical protein P154DRAFT_267932 [Amniculicola lignicola CBS 123094]|uniref:Uncharacterized protein n=1 Tax=Amniculicola lignicola CBS 123094 TaxID=1392246 RepID=A0A6A5WBC1_9PLEO|nr:hypothetical protein P154DRAFT_267932 [Amniculicola lignicola CBS 123094]